MRYLETRGWNRKDSVTVINEALIYAVSSNRAALTIGVQMPSGTDFTFINRGKIIGHGGRGGATWEPLISGSKDYGNLFPRDGEGGGTGIEILLPVKLINYNIIAGGGGGGGGDYYQKSPGGFGAGNKLNQDAATNGATGLLPESVVYYSLLGNREFFSNKTNGEYGLNTYQAPNGGGAGSSGGLPNQSEQAAGAGGGGAWGSAGGSSGSYKNDQSKGAKGKGGPGGLSVKGKSNIMNADWMSSGFFYGASE
jgi:hypothetical protein